MISLTARRSTTQHVIARLIDREELLDDVSHTHLAYIAQGFWWGARTTLDTLAGNTGTSAYVEVEVKDDERTLFTLVTGSWGGPDLAYP